MSPRAELDGRRRVAFDRAKDAEGALDALVTLSHLGVLLGRGAAVSDRLFVAEAAPKALGELEQAESEIEARVRARAHRVRRADLAVFAFAGREVTFE